MVGVGLFALLVGMGVEGMVVSAAARALAAIDELVDDCCISPEVGQRGRDFVGLIFREGTVYASVAPLDDGDLSFYWVAGDWCVSVDLYGGEMLDVGWFSFRKGGEVKRVCGDVPVWLVGAVAEFSAYVELLNPLWRDVVG